MSRPAAPSGTTTRAKRTPVGQRNVLTVSGKDPEFTYRVVNDTGDRIAQFLEAGYEFVDAATHRVGDKRVNNASPEGSKAQVSVGKGDKAFVMRIKNEWYNEDQFAKQKEVDRLEQSIKQTASGTGDYGSVSISVGTPR
jgi:hypothetical protein